MRFIFLMAVVLLIPGVALSKTIRVPVDYPTIQEALNVSGDGDVILVAPNIYFENINVTDAVTLRSDVDMDSNTYDISPAETVIDGSAKLWSVVEISDDAELDGFTIRNGTGIWYTSGYHGVGFGGGIKCTGCSPIISNNIICHNSLNQTPGMDHNAALGAGIFCEYASPTICNNLIHDNYAKYPPHTPPPENHGYGGGIYCTGAGPSGNAPQIIGNILCSNTANSGGGICCIDVDDKEGVLIADNIVANNYSDSGGGLYFKDMYFDVMSDYVNITNNTVYFNSADSGGGIFFENVTGFFLGAEIKNTVFWCDDASTGYEMVLADDSDVYIDYSDLDTQPNSVHEEPGSNLYWGSNMIDVDPLFVDEDGLDDDPYTWHDNDLHIRYASPCRDTGENGASGIQASDFEGDPRIAHGTVDMGADEFYTHLYYKGDAVPGGKVELKIVGVPGTSPARLWLGAGVLFPPLPTKYGDWHLQFPLLVDLALGPIPAPDGILILSVAIPSDTVTPLYLPLQAGVGMELTNLCRMVVQ